MSAIYYEGSLYAIVDGPSWQEAEANANKLGGHLVTINNKEENEFLVDTFDEKISYGGKIGDLSGAYPVPHAWIGMNDAEEEGTYVWSSGEPVTYFEPSKDNQFTGDGLTWTAEYSGGPASWVYKNEDYVGIQLVSGLGEDYWEEGMWEDTWDDMYLYEQGIAEIPFVQFGDSAYVLVEGPSWEEAQANAEKLGGNLVTINSAEENEWLFNTFKTESESGLHIGLKKVQSGLYEWQTETGSNYTNWASGEPNGIFDEYNQYVHMYTNTGLWNDHPDSPFQGIAEIKIDVEDYSTYSEEDYTDVQWHELSYTSFSSVKYQSLNWSYADFGGFNDDTWSNLYLGKI